jgi:hypothetical protein
MLASYCVQCTFKTRDFTIDVIASWRRGARILVEESAEKIKSDDFNNASTQLGVALSGINL